MQLLSSIGTASVKWKESLKDGLCGRILLCAGGRFGRIWKDSTFAWDWSLAFPLGGLMLFVFEIQGSFSLCCYSFLLASPVSAIAFLYFQTVAEVVKELEKNEKIRVQLECNKPGENVSTDLASSQRVARETAEWPLRVCACCFIVHIRIHI